MAQRVERDKSKGSWLWLLLLLIPFVALLWPAFYASKGPEFGGIPFFYWYQFLWVIISTALTALAYRFARRT
ncbi:MAG: hypothetical protein NVSMB52_13160 [Chloroflexota bacterium]